MKQYRVRYFHAKTPPKGLVGPELKSLREANDYVKGWLIRGARRAIVEVREVGPWVPLDEKRPRTVKPAYAAGKVSAGEVERVVQLKRPARDR